MEGPDQLTRREFLKLSAATGAAALFPDIKPERGENLSKGWRWAECDIEFQNPDDPRLKYQPGIYAGEFSVAGIKEVDGRMLGVMIPQGADGKEIHKPTDEEIESILHASEQTSQDFAAAGWPDVQTHKLIHSSGKEIELVPIIFYLAEDDPDTDEELGESFSSLACQIPDEGEEDGPRQRAPVVSIVPSRDTKDGLVHEDYIEWLAIITAHEKTHAHTNALIQKSQGAAATLVDREGVATYYALASQWRGSPASLPEEYINNLARYSGPKALDIPTYYKGESARIMPSRDTDYGAYVYWHALHNIITSGQSRPEPAVLAIYKDYVTSSQEAENNTGLALEQAQAILT